MQQGTIHVRALLGPEVVVSDREIQDALWHYYYDVDKSVDYLRGMSSRPCGRFMLNHHLGLKQPKKAKKPKQKTESKFDIASKAASVRQDVGKSTEYAFSNSPSLLTRLPSSLYGVLGLEQDS
jgi:hypothetical protein